MTKFTLLPPFASTDERDDGFTMVEILVVIIIIGILAAIAIPVYLNQQKAANDAAIKTDLRNMASVVMAWQTAGNSNAEFLKAAGTSNKDYQRKALHVVGENADHSLTLLPPDIQGQSGAKLWNETIPDYPATVSDGVVMEVIMRDTVSANEFLAEDSVFCIIGSHSGNSSYTYKYGSGGTTEPFTKVLFYDSAMGGLNTMEDLLEKPDSEKGGCGVHVSRYKKLIGAS